METNIKPITPRPSAGGDFGEAHGNLHISAFTAVGILSRSSLRQRESRIWRQRRKGKSPGTLSLTFPWTRKRRDRRHPCFRDRSNGRSYWRRRNKGFLPCRASTSAQRSWSNICWDSSCNSSLPKSPKAHNFGPRTKLGRGLQSLMPR